MPPEQSGQNPIPRDAHVFAKSLGDVPGIREVRAFRQFETHLISQANWQAQCVAVICLVGQSRSRQPLERSPIMTAIPDAIDLARPHGTNRSVDLVLRTGLPDYQAVLLARAGNLRRDVFGYSA